MKDKEFKFRLSNKLYEMLNIKAKTSNKSRSDYLRTLILNSRVKVDNSKNMATLIGSINIIDNNIVKTVDKLSELNSYDKLDDAKYENLLDVLTIIEYQLTDILKSI